VPQLLRYRVRIKWDYKTILTIFYFSATYRTGCKQNAMASIRKVPVQISASIPAIVMIIAILRVCRRMYVYVVLDRLYTGSYRPFMITFPTPSHPRLLNSDVQSLQTNKCILSSQSTTSRILLVIHDYLSNILIPGY
jgi:hypothetical protein